MIVIVDYGMGNLSSIANALKEIGCKVCISNKVQDIKRADRIILPGVGSFKDGIKNIKKLGLDKSLYEEVIIKKRPFLGICLGMQLLAQEGYEGGQNKGLGWIKGCVKKLDLNGNNLKLPHMGWNDIKIKPDTSLFEGIGEDTNFYFVHSYHAICNDEKDVVATCNYGVDFVAAIRKGNIFATQFHPEKSHKVGLRVLKNFVEYKD